MHVKAVHALLSDPSGSILLVRRRDSVLWGLPGGEVRAALDLDELLTTYCHRQTGVSPEFGGKYIEFTLAGKVIAATTGTIARARAAARGRVEAVMWAVTTELPMQIEPSAKIAIALWGKASLSAESPVAVAQPLGVIAG